MKSYAELIERIPMLEEDGREWMMVQPLVVPKIAGMLPASPDGLAVDLEPGRDPKLGRAVLVPILGEISAGSPRIVWEQSDDAVITDSHFLSNSVKGVFAVRVSGDSMIGDGILEGDILFVRKNVEAQPGDIVLVALDAEATCKRYYPEGDRIRFQPSNPSIPAITIKMTDFRSTMILGVVHDLHRTYSVFQAGGKKGLRGANST